MLVLLVLVLLVVLSSVRLFLAAEELCGPAPGNTRWGKQKGRGSRMSGSAAWG